MYKKIMSIILIFVITIYSVIGINVNESKAVAPAIPLIAKYLIGSAIAAGGVCAADNAALDKAIGDYVSSRPSMSERIARAGLVAQTAGYTVFKLDDYVWKDVMGYISENFVSGYQSILGEYGEVSGSFSSTSFDDFDITYCSSDTIYIYNSDGSSYHSYTKTVTEDSSNFYVSVVRDDGRLYTETFSKDVYDSIGGWAVNDNILAYWVHQYDDLYGSDDPYWCRVSIVNSGSYYGGVNLENKTYSGYGQTSVNYNNGTMVEDSSYDWGNSNAVDNSRALPLPPGDLTDDQMQDLIDGLLGKTAEEVQEQDLDLEWWLDENGNIIKVKKGEEPPGGKDGKILISPIPLPDQERLPGEPEVQVIDEPPIVTEETLPDGTIKRTTVVPKTTVTTTYDPKTGTKTSTTVVTKTITIQIIDPSTGTEISREDDTKTEPGPTIEETIPKSTTINWEPIKRPAGELTWKFPFSLPWDLKRSFQQLVTNDKWNPVIPINFDAPLMGNVAFNIDLTMFDGLIKVVRVIELLLFDVGLILITRKLMGGDV